MKNTLSHTKSIIFESRDRKLLSGKDKTRGMLVAIAPDISDRQILMAALRPGVKVVVLDPDGDGLEQITRALSAYPAASLQIVCHGGSGQLYLGNSVISSENIASYSRLLQEWAVEDILLYACNVAADNSQLLADLHQLTGANIAGTRYRVGNEAKGGSWHLETRIGSLASESAFLPGVKNYPGVLVSFTTEKLDVGVRPDVIAVGEFNGDSFPDVAVASTYFGTIEDYDEYYEEYDYYDYSQHRIAIVSGDKDGTFTVGPTSESFYILENIPSSEDIVVADFDGDGTEDVAVVGSYTGEYYFEVDSALSVLLNDGKGNFVDSVLESGESPYTAIAAGDLNGDGLQDLAIAGATAKTDTDEEGYTFFSNAQDVAVRLGKGDDTFEDAKIIKEGGNPSSISIEDINGDDRLDLIVTKSHTDKLSVVQGKGNGEFKKATFYDVGERPVDNVVADFNGDSLPDVAVANFLSGDISVLLNKGNGKLQAATNYKVGKTSDNIVVADFNEDAILDLAVSVSEEDDFSKQNIVILQGNGDGTFEKDSTIDEIDADYLAVEDLNRDGSPDLVVSSFGSTEIAVLFNDAVSETVKISGTSKNDQLTGTNESESMEGLGGNDILNAKNGDDILDGGKGKDTMNGGKGDDTYFVDNSKDVIKESPNGGSDTVNASINYTLPNNVENLVLTGKKPLKGTGNNAKNEIAGNDGKNVIKGKGGNDLLNGEGGNDKLFGDGGKDTLIGGGGNDIFEGGKGNDTLTGGDGKDKFVFNSKRSFRSKDFGVDTIDDFVLGEDKILLDRTTFKSLKNNKFRDGIEFEVVDTNAAAKTSDAFIVYNETSGGLFYNANGSKGGFGGGGLFATLEGAPELGADDFQIRK